MLLGKKEKLATSSVRVMVFSDTAGAGFQGIVHVRPVTRQAEEHDPAEAQQCISCPYTIPVNPSAVLAVEWHGKPPTKRTRCEK